jgi:putative nucleotidyltransferase with HDIG domain
MIVSRDHSSMTGWADMNNPQQGIRNGSANILLTFLICKSQGLFAHSYVTAQLCRNVARALSLSQSTTSDLYYAGLFHDIGKVVVNSSLLLKDGELTRAEYAIMKQHAVAGEQLIRRSGVLGRLRPYIRHHHEMPNGRGYPDGLTLEKIPYPVRALAVADKFSAMTVYRNYRPQGTLSKEEAMERLRPLSEEFFDGSSGKVCDALLVSPVDGMLSTAYALSKAIQLSLL